MSGPLAYFLTWTCHGTWLHGDSRGSTSDTQNKVGTPHLAPNSALRDYERELASGQPSLSPQARGVVEQAVRDHCAIRGWKMLAVNARSNHVHVVVDCPTGVSPERAMTEFKAWGTRRLRDSGLTAPHAPVWTEHGSTRWINDHASLAAAIDYVLRLQDLKPD